VRAQVQINAILHSTTVQPNGTAQLRRLSAHLRIVIVQSNGTAQRHCLTVQPNCNAQQFSPTTTPIGASPNRNCPV